MLEFIRFEDLVTPFGIVATFRTVSATETNEIRFSEDSLSTRVENLCKQGVDCSTEMAVLVELRKRKATME